MTIILNNFKVKETSRSRKVIFKQITYQLLKLKIIKKK